jgi:hypothetical protein
VVLSWANDELLLPFIRVMASTVFIAACRRHEHARERAPERGERALSLRRPLYAASSSMAEPKWTSRDLLCDRTHKRGETREGHSASDDSMPGTTGGSAHRRR